MIPRTWKATKIRGVEGLDTTSYDTRRAGWITPGRHIPAQGVDAFLSSRTGGLGLFFSLPSFPFIFPALPTLASSMPERRYSFIGFFVFLLPWRALLHGSGQAMRCRWHCHVTLFPFYRSAALVTPDAHHQLPYGNCAFPFPFFRGLFFLGRAGVGYDRHI